MCGCLLPQEVDGVDVLLFGMYVQEYDHNAPGPNSKTAYLSYLDSVKVRPRIICDANYAWS